MLQNRWFTMPQIIPTGLFRKWTTEHSTIAGDAHCGTPLIGRLLRQALLWTNIGYTTLCFLRMFLDVSQLSLSKWRLHPIFCLPSQFLYCDFEEKWQLFKVGRVLKIISSSNLHIGLPSVSCHIYEQCTRETLYFTRNWFSVISTSSTPTECWSDTVIAA